MDRNSLILILRRCFETEGNCAFLHLSDGSEMLVSRKPSFLDTFLNVKIEYDYGKENIIEEINVGYGSILYIIVTSVDNLNKIAKEQDRLHGKPLKIDKKLR